MIREGLEPLKFNGLIVSRERREKIDRYSIYADDLKNDIRFNAKILKTPPELSQDTPSKQNGKKSFSISDNIEEHAEEKQNENPTNLHRSSRHKSSLDENYQTRSSISRKSTEIGNKICFVCKKNPSDVVFYPCRHNVICTTCAKAIGTVCVICQGKIQRRSVLLLSQSSAL